MDDTADGAGAMSRISALRNILKEKGVDAFFIPRTDEFQSEYVAPYAERLHWLTGFSGSAGTAIVMADKAAFFTDGRYTLQAQGEVDTSLFDPTKVSILRNRNRHYGSPVSYTHLTLPTKA